MNKTYLLISTAVLGLIAACHTSKKSTTSTAASTAPTTTVVATSTVASSSTTTASVFVPSKKTEDGIYEPGTEELVAIQPQYKDATLEQLKEGYTLYAKSACVSCHGAVNIYTFRMDKWQFIIQDMAYRAKLTQSQKDAVLRYVYAIKAAEPNKK